MSWRATRPRGAAVSLESAWRSAAPPVDLPAASAGAVVAASPRVLSLSRAVIPPAPLVLPIGLLLLGALIGLPFALTPAIGVERIASLAITLGLAAAAIQGLRALPDRRAASVALAFGLLAVLHGLWMMGASGPGTFRGTVGALVLRVAGPLIDRWPTTDGVEVSNARYVWGMASVCLVPIFSATAALLARPGRKAVLGAAVFSLASLVVLLGTGQRGGLMGLVIGAVALAAFWWRRGWLVGLGLAPVAVVLAALGVLDKGFDLSSTFGRATYWSDLARLLVEFPLTGVGLGLDTANRTANFYELNSDPERVFYAHNTFVQAYLEQGPLGFLGMLLLPLLVLAATVLARRERLSRGRRALAAGGFGLFVALEVHGLTDQVLMPTLGFLAAVLATTPILAALGPRSAATLARWTQRLAIGTAALAVVALVALAATPAGRAQVLLNLGGLQLDGALLRGPQPDRAAGVAAQTLQAALAQDPGHPAALRDLARARLATNDIPGALDALRQAAESPRLDAFDMLQIAHVHRDLGFANDAYAWATRAFAAWGRTPPAAVINPYREASVQDDSRVRTLADQGEAALRAKTYDQALELFLRALAFAPNNTYLQERVGDAERGVYRMQLRDGIQTP